MDVMCCFSQPVELVADTSIFARGVNGRQFLVYSMRYAAATELAMVLPLPVPPWSTEDTVTFINLKGYPNFFVDLANGFPRGGFLRASRGGGRSLEISTPRLEVHDVGDFEASFVPCVEDFERLDERFRIPRQVWDRLPAYRDFGFAVFKLKQSPRRLGGVLRRLLGASSFRARIVHPMAFEFPRRNPDLLYFPTLHVHDRQVHAHATFDHMLYCQAAPDMEPYLVGWWESNDPASRFMNCDRTKGIIAPDFPCWRLTLAGWLQNTDALVGKRGALPVAWKG
jgi:hypothetical protein